MEQEMYVSMTHQALSTFIFTSANFIIYFLLLSFK